MKKIIPALVILLLTQHIHAQYTGVNTKTPGSTLDVKGSIAATYNSQTGNYTLTANDFYVAFTGATASKFTLPAANTTPSFTGRIYYIKNSSSDAELTIEATEADGIGTDGNTPSTSSKSIILEPSQTLMLIKTDQTNALTRPTWQIAQIQYVPSGSRFMASASLQTGSGSLTCNLGLRHDLNLTNIDFQTRAGSVNLANDNITVPRTGYYEISTTILPADIVGATTNDICVQFMIDGSAAFIAVCGRSQTDRDGATLTRIVHLNKNQTVGASFYIGCNTGTNTILNGSNLQVIELR